MIESAQQFAELRKSEDPAEYRRAAQEEAHKDVWIEIINTMPDMRVWVAENKSVPVEILHILSKDSNVDVRFAVASKRRINRQIMTQLAMDKDESVRQRIAYNKKTPEDILKQLSLDAESIVSDVAKSRLKNF